MKNSFHPTTESAHGAAQARATELRALGHQVNVSPMYGGYFISDISTGTQEEFLAETVWTERDPHAF